MGNSRRYETLADHCWLADDTVTTYSSVSCSRLRWDLRHSVCRHQNLHAQYV